MSMFTMENKMNMANLNLTRNYLWDLIEIDWADIKIKKNMEPISMPNKITVPLSHKVKTRNIMSKPFEVQITVKSQNQWSNITEFTPKKKGHVKAMCTALEGAKQLDY